jgi:curved DNA-binding protein CbpA
MKKAAHRRKEAKNLVAPRMSISRPDLQSIISTMPSQPQQQFQSPLTKESSKYIDCYKMLGVSMDAEPDEIKRAFRKKAMIYHPDRLGEDASEAQRKEYQERYMDLQTACKTLLQPRKRKAYDVTYVSKFSDFKNVERDVGYEHVGLEHDCVMLDEETGEAVLDLDAFNRKFEKQAEQQAETEAKRELEEEHGFTSSKTFADVQSAYEQALKDREDDQVYAPDDTLRNMLSDPSLSAHERARRFNAAFRMAADVTNAYTSPGTGMESMEDARKYDHVPDAFNQYGGSTSVGMVEFDPDSGSVGNVNGFSGVGVFDGEKLVEGFDASGVDFTQVDYDKYADNPEDVEPMHADDLAKRLAQYEEETAALQPPGSDTGAQEAFFKHEEFATQQLHRELAEQHGLDIEEICQPFADSLPQPDQQQQEQEKEEDA